MATAVRPPSGAVPEGGRQGDGRAGSRADPVAAIRQPPSIARPSIAPSSIARPSIAPLALPRCGRTVGPTILAAGSRASFGPSGRGILIPLAGSIIALCSGTAFGQGTALAADAPPLHQFSQVAISPDGRMVASLEGDVPAVEGREVPLAVTVRPTEGGAPRRVDLPCAGAGCTPSFLAWAPDGRHLAFVLRQPGQREREVLEADPATGRAHVLLRFDGTLGALRYGPDGTLALLATAGAHKEPGATQAAARLSGEIGAQEDEQRIATVSDGTLRWQSPPNLYVYEFDWRPDPAAPHRLRFVGTAAPGNGDNNWWTARLFGFEDAAATQLYAPSLEQQLATPVVSPDGRAVAFVGGLMSDFGSTGGDAFLLPLGGAGTTPRNLTAGAPFTVTGLSWRCGAAGGAATLAASGLRGADGMLLGLDPSGGAPRTLWSAPRSVSTGRGAPMPSCGAGRMAAILQDFTTAPEIVTAAMPPGRAAGAAIDWRLLTRDNAAQVVAATARSLDWRSDEFTVQGWLLSPAGAPSGAGAPKGPMIVSVHGGPAAAAVSTFLSDRGQTLFLLRAGYRVLLPNPRGSFGQGERFAQANRRDFGHGDLRDILRGVDAAEAAESVDDRRLGLTGYSYGGYMTMWAVTQTNRFRAAVAGAGVSDWQSYYGENGIDQWMLPFFGASVYDDPAIYARSSPISFIKQAHTPSFAYVGDADVECPLPQTQEFIHALRTLGVPTEFVVYPGQGHGMHDPAALADSRRRTLDWFARWLGAPGHPAAGTPERHAGIVRPPGTDGFGTDASGTTPSKDRS
ncbi:prolyl oligopeptidase family serine peptidase [Rhizosaccharibacter radicis]|uniref:Alpha/beta fold hydrolase n=1 Tax=Rhizosaccharibacter radicis TaxID=2782605 RepID=A0ABT1VU10_9PROT|nr:alpha/beta fold hydrolase [Acetobacteraceae bacterium KSS12]